jgi:hypothetical protein
MTVKVTSSQEASKVKVISTDQTTIVKQVKIGTPVRRVTGGSFSINSISGVDTSGKQDGSVLVYNATTSNFEATLNLDKQLVNGGNF